MAIKTLKQTLEDVFNMDKESQYMLLDRMRLDCLYYLGYGHRNAKNLWAKNVSHHIYIMKVLCAELSPEWLSPDEIEDYEREMRPTRAGAGMTAIQAVNKALAFFEKSKVGEFRSLSLQEWFGRDNDIKDVVIHIVYSVNGDYSASAEAPFYCKVWKEDGKIKAERCPYYF